MFNLSLSFNLTQILIRDTFTDQTLNKTNTARHVFFLVKF